ncbi:RpiB/LacA/LacB family sugar-phosphate isomerase [Candidatus Woesearchaeota archaeon]|nr:RpiB/LacA/LacB family sugar-phosphate isomerase [Candidatus Woesearchaeota archaeon]
MIYLGADHGGFELKSKIKRFLDSLGYEYEDKGNMEYDKDDDYPEYAFAVAEAVGKRDDPSRAWKDRSKGILLCRSAGGVVVAANKVRGVSAIAVSDVKSAKHSREHNDANVIGLSGDWMTEEQAMHVVKVWLETEFSHDERHVRRIKMIREYEEND